MDSHKAVIGVDNAVQARLAHEEEVRRTWVVLLLPEVEGWICNGNAKMMIVSMLKRLTKR